MKAALLILLSALPLAAQTPATNSASAAPSPTVAALAQPFFTACLNGNLAQAQALVKQGADVNARSEGNPPLVGAACYQHWDVVKFLLSKGVDVNAGTPAGARALSYVCKVNQTDIALALLNAGEDPNLCDPHFLLPIVYVARFGNVELMKAFIAHHADVNLNGVDGPAIYHAVGHQHPDIVQLLLDSGARVDIPTTTGGHSGDPDCSILGSAAINNDLPMIDLLLAHGASINNPGEDGETPLAEAIINAKSSTILHLIEKGADPSLPDRRDETPLMLATLYGYDPAVMQGLLDHGAKIEQTNGAGRTALIFAAMHIQEDPVDFLLDHGANVNAADKSGATALLYAGDRGESEMVDFLAAHGALHTDVHIIPRPQANPPLPPAQAFGLAVGAMYAQYNGVNPHVFGDNFDDRPGEVRAELREDWDAKDKATFLQALSDLHDHGFRVLYHDDGLRLGKIDDTAWALLVKNAPFLGGEEQRVRDAYKKWGDRTGLAWDLCRYANMVNRGYAAGYLTYGEALADLLPVAREVQKSFSSWQEMSDNFLDGRTIWNHGHEDRFDNCLKLLLDPNEKESVWNQIPWKTNLGS